MESDLMSVPATSGRLCSTIDEMQIGDYIPYHYKAHTSGIPGQTWKFGATGTEIPLSGDAVPDGIAYAIKVARGLLVSDRVVQHTVSWNSLNAQGLIQGNPYKGGIQFNGTSSYVVVPYNASLSPTAAISVLLEASMTDWTTDKVSNIVSRLQTGGYGFVKRGSSDLFDFTIYANEDYQLTSCNLSSLTPGKHIFVGTYDGRYQRLYVDGVLAATNDLGATYTMTYAYNNGLFFGCDAGTAVAPDATPYYFDGIIYRTGVWNRALTESEVATGLSGDESGTVGYWDSQNIFSATLYNRFANGNGTLTNCTVLDGETIKIRSLTGGVAYATNENSETTINSNTNKFPINNEFDEYLINETLGEKITENSDNTWNHLGMFTWTQETPILDLGASTTRVTRASNLNTGTTKGFTALVSSTANTATGFRPVFEYRE